MSPPGRSVVGNRQKEIRMKRRAPRSAAGIGRHAARQGLDTPTTKEIAAEGGILLCKRCKAQHHDKRWYAPEEEGKFPTGSEIKETLCPGCHRVEHRICNGETIIEGPGLDKLRSNIHSLIANVEDRCWHENPCSRIMSFNDLGERLEIYTTSAWLAERIGKEMRKAFKGKLEIKTFPEESYARVVWTFD